jgi:class 3 adenylate cyclase/YHS domain-containing protein
MSTNRIEATFAFIDLAGFTALTEAQGDEDAADVATGFADLTEAALGPGDRLVKTIGDAVLVTSPTPEQGVELVENVLIHAARDSRLPSLRAGLHHGDAVMRAGDFFGAAVNLAARVASEAHAGEVLGTLDVADAASRAGIPVAPLGEVLLKNVRKPVELYSLALIVGTGDTPVDPVCRQPVDRRTAAGRLNYRGIEYWFCSLTCTAAFAANPGWHSAETQRPTMTDAPPL